MSPVRTAHTADLDEATLEAARALLHDVFGDDMSDHDWEHALGGIHALAYDGAGALVGHASVVQRRLIHQGRALRTGYVEGVAVRADRRRCGYASALMAALERIIEGAYDLGALAASDMAIPFYVRRGWQPWQGSTSVLTPSGVTRTPEEDGSVYVLPAAAALDLTAELTCDWRDGAVW